MDRSIDSTLYYAITEMDERLDELGYKNHVSLREDLNSFILYEEKRNNLNPGMNVLICGSGIGIDAITLAYHGYKAIAIELDKTLYDESIKFLDRYKTVLKTTPKIINGNYYPKEYASERLRNPAILKMERIEMNKYSKQDANQKFYPVSDEDVYTKHAIDMRKIDVVFANNYFNHMPSIFDMFIRYTRDDAMFLSVEKEFKAIANEMGLKTELMSNIIRKNNNIIQE
jgi:hypothetical protein